MAADCEEDLDISLEESSSLVGGVQRQISFQDLYRNRGESQCRVVWQAGNLFYTCSTCGLDPSSAICRLCFYGGNHEGHKFVWVVSEDGGFCDCGDSALWRESGFCASNPLHLRLCSVSHEFEEEQLGSTLDGGAKLSASSSRPCFSPSTTCYYSTRIQSMIENRSKFISDVEFEIENSKVHWSEMELSPTAKNLGELNCACFLALKQKYSSHWQSGGFFKERDDIVIGKKIGEGGQAEIYEVGKDYVVKIFHPSFLLEDLENQWPPGVLNDFNFFVFGGRRFSLIQGGMLLNEKRFLDRFAILMERHWGDL